MRGFHDLFSFRVFALRLLFGALASVFVLAGKGAQASGLPSTPAVATVDLTTAAGLASVSGAWRYADARVVESAFRSAGPTGQPTGEPVRTFDIAPHAGAADFDDSGWEKVASQALSKRRGNGRLSFAWYRLTFTVPERIGAFAIAGRTLVFETSVDDYAEIWVDGEIARAPAQSGGSVVAGWNATNRLVAARNAKPGQNIRIAVFAANGPLSNPPTNFVYLRSARLSFHDAAPGPVAVEPAEVNVEVVRKDPALDAIVSANPKVFKLAEGFEFTEGPVWTGDSLLFSDPNSNVIYSYSESAGLGVYRRNSGYDGADIGEYRQPGSNGLALDAEGRLVVNEHGRRRVSRIEKDGRVSVLASGYDGRRLNSPNDLVYHSDGSLYFTDPPFGLPKVFDDPRKELPFSGVYRLSAGKVELLASDLSGPNGIALSPDEKFLYVGNWDEKRKVVMRYALRDGGGIGDGMVFFDMTLAAGEDAIDGVKVDVEGNVYVSGPGGLWILSKDGRHLGTIATPRHPHNMAWGGEDGRTLYLCARSGLYRIALGVAGAGTVAQRSARAAQRSSDASAN